ncbi:hypothetical protein OPQ81_007647 [Rhizoctonia solani]|nr:hypothetical protein OPQ81_007647 [Rhizoctonia solani]
MVKGSLSTPDALGTVDTLVAECGSDGVDHNIASLIHGSSLIANQRTLDLKRQPSPPVSYNVPALPTPWCRSRSRLRVLAPKSAVAPPNLSLDITGLTVASGPNSASVNSAQASPLMSASTLVFNPGLNHQTMLHPNYLNAPPQNAQTQTQSPIQQNGGFTFEMPTPSHTSTSGHSRKRSVSGEPRNESPPRPSTGSGDSFDFLTSLMGGYDMPVSNGVSPNATGTGSGSPTTTSDPEPDVDMDGDFKDIEMGGGVFGGPTPGSSNAKPSNNNFVTKLFQMINDPKSASFIAWNETGTSFIVQSVGEFSRSILGSHFKHSNFSSFVRQLNMYGFHKVNKTPRSQRTSQDNQTWEFSHPKFLKGRVDLLDQIKRKALDTEPPGRNTRVELPAEVATQLRRMVQDHQSLKHALAEERARVEGLTDVVKMLYDIVAATHPERMPGQFPNDLLDPSENPPIYITSPPESPLPPPFSLPNGGTDGRGHVKRMRVDDNFTTALGLDHGLNHSHPQHSQTHSTNQDGARRLIRARSDSAPHGMGLGHYLTSTIPQHGRPRSGSSLSGYHPQQQPGGVKDEYSLGMGLDLGI